MSDSPPQRSLTEPRAWQERPGLIAVKPPDLGEPWETECAAGPTVEAKRVAEAWRVVDRPGTLLLTGATGFLGGFLLAELLAETDARIVCLGRASDPGALKERIAANLTRQRRTFDPQALADRVEAVVGDVSKPRWGLDEPTWSDLAGRIDTILHNAARINLANSYTRLKPINVGGTLAALQLAVTGRGKRLHYVSSIGSVSARWYVELGHAYENDPPRDLGGMNGGYPQTKAVAETLVARLGRAGMPVTIHRPGLLIGDSVTGAWEADDLLSNLLRSWVRFHAAFPFEGDLDLTPVDYVARGIVALTTTPASVGRAFHLVNARNWTVPQLLAMLAELGHRVEMLPYEDWLEAAERLAFETHDPRIGAAVRLFPPAAAAKHKTFPLVYRIRFDDRDARALLEPRGIVCPPVDPPLIARYIAAMDLESGR